MSAEQFNTVIEQGADFVLDIVYKDDYDQIVDLTGYDADMQLREEIDSSTTIADLSSALNVGITIDGPEGNIVCRIPADTTENFTFENNYCYYDLFITSPTNERIKILKGKLTLDKAVTR